MIDAAYWNRVADVAIPVAAGADQHIHRIGRTIVKSPRGIEAAAIVGPADVLFVERIANGAQRRRRNGSAGIDCRRVGAARSIRIPGRVLLIM